MNVWRVSALAIGASLIGSTVYVIIETRNCFSISLLVGGFLLLLHGTGFLQWCRVQFLRLRRTRKPLIGIINDLDWNEERVRGYVPPEMAPETWRSRIHNAIQERNVACEVRLIKITKSWRRSGLDRYYAIINPYGSVYPEVNVKELTVWKSIRDYVLHGGIFVNVADIPFYWAYDPESKIRYDLVKYHYLYESGKVLPFGSYAETPFSSELKIGIVNTRLQLQLNVDLPQSRDPNWAPIHAMVDRAVVVGKLEGDRRIIEVDHVESVVEEREWRGDSGTPLLVTPLCSIHFGKGKFLISLLFLSEQLEPSQEQITNLLCNLVIEDIKERNVRHRVLSDGR